MKIATILLAFLALQAQSVKICEDKEAVVLKMTAGKEPLKVEEYYNIKFIRAQVTEMKVKVMKAKHHTAECSGSISVSPGCKTQTTSLIYTLDQIRMMSIQNKCLVGDSCPNSCEGDDMEKCTKMGMMSSWKSPDQEMVVHPKNNYFWSWCHSDYACSIKQLVVQPCWYDEDTVNFQIPNLDIIEIKTDKQMVVSGDFYVYVEDPIVVEKTTVSLKCFKGESLDCQTTDGHGIVVKNGIAMDWNVMYIPINETRVHLLDDSQKFNGESAKVYDLQRVFNQVIFETARSNNNFGKIQNRIINIENIMKSLIYYLYNLTSDPLGIHFDGIFEGGLESTKDELVLHPCVDREQKRLSSIGPKRFSYKNATLFTEINLDTEDLRSIKFNIHDYLQSVLKDLERQRDRRMKGQSATPNVEVIDPLSSFFSSVFDLMKTIERFVIWISFVILVIIFVKRL